MEWEYRVLAAHGKTTSGTRRSLLRALQNNFINLNSQNYPTNIRVEKDLLKCK